MTTNITPGTWVENVKTGQYAITLPTPAHINGNIVITYDADGIKLQNIADSDIRNLFRAPAWNPDGTPRKTPAAHFPTPIDQVFAKMAPAIYGGWTVAADGTYRIIIGHIADDTAGTINQRIAQVVLLDPATGAQDLVDAQGLMALPINAAFTADVRPIK